MRALLFAFCFAWSSMSFTAEAPVEATLDAVVVSGVQPGPGLWKVSKGEHVLWVLGTLSPLPRRMEWDASAVTEIIASSKEVLLSPSVKMNADTGFFGTLALLPSLIGARKNPDGRTLDEVLPPELYARWTAQKKLYLGRGKGIEKRRPVFAGYHLYQKALKRTGLTLDTRIVPLVEKAAKKHDVPITRPHLAFKLENTREAIRDFKSADLDDVECFRKTLGRVESDLDTMRERANAWATGDLETLEALPYDDQNRECADAFLRTALARDRGFDRLPDQLAAVWLDAAEAALAKHDVSFATLPITEMLKQDGYLAKLEARGYRIERP